MNDRHKLSRREALILPLAGGFGLSVDLAAAQQAQSNAAILVAYFSRTGNTRVIARQIRRAHRADIFEINPAEPYPEDYQEIVQQAERERRSGYEPPLAAAVPNIETYAAVFLGFPIWGTTAPSVIRSFLSRHDLSEKTLVPFITHGGYGAGSSRAVLAAHAPRSRLLQGFTLRQDQERQTLAQVTRWLGGVRIER